MQHQSELKTAQSPHPGLDRLVKDALSHLESLGYRPDTRYAHQKTWNAFRRFAEKESSEDKLSTALVQKYLESRGICPDEPEKQISDYKRHIRAAMRILTDFGMHGCFHHVNRVTREVKLPASMDAVLSNYVEFYREFVRNRPRTLLEKKWNVTKFLHYLDSDGVKSTNEIQASMISEFLMSVAHWKPTTLATMAGHLRSFLRYLNMRGLVSGVLIGEMPKIHFRKNEPLPSVWHPEDIAALVAAVDRSSPCGKRDYAILLLVTTLGMRVGDIRTLRLEHLRWDEARIEMIQAKTDVPLSLPITNGIGEALIDYLRNARPKSLHREVFLRVNAPYDPFVPTNNLYYMITSYRRRAGIAASPEKRRGMHSLRHTVASRLLEAGTPLETISAVMGHLSSETTWGYTKIDVEALRNVAIDLEEKPHA